MKNLIITIMFLVSLPSFAFEAEVISSHYEKSICVTILKVPSGEKLGLVEDIWDCFYAREAKKQTRLLIDERFLSEITDPSLSQHLQSIDPQLSFLFSDGD